MTSIGLEPKTDLDDNKDNSPKCHTIQNHNKRRTKAEMEL